MCRRSRAAGGRARSGGEGGDGRDRAFVDGVDTALIVLQEASTFVSCRIADIEERVHASAPAGAACVRLIAAGRVRPTRNPRRCWSTMPIDRARRVRATGRRAIRRAMRECGKRGLVDFERGSRRSLEIVSRAAQPGAGGGSRHAVGTKPLPGDDRRGVKTSTAYLPGC